MSKRAASTDTSGGPPRRPYQLEAIQNHRDARDRGIRRQLCVLPTGSGKTIVLGDVIDENGGEEALLLSHTDETLEQARDKFTKFQPHLADRIGKVKAKDNQVEAGIVL